MALVKHATRRPAKKGFRAAHAFRAAAEASAKVAVVPKDLRTGFGLKRETFSRLANFSPRKLAQLEAGARQTPATKQRLAELERLRAALSEVVKAETLGEWMETPNPSFEGLKPLEVVERGQIDRLWRMYHQLSSGEPG